MYRHSLLPFLENNLFSSLQLQTLTEIHGDLVKMKISTALSGAENLTVRLQMKM